MEQASRLKVQAQVFHKGIMTILALVGAKPLKSSIDMVLVSIDGLSHTVICPCHGTQDTGQLCCHDLQQFIAQHQPGQKEYQLMIPSGILCHIIPQHFRWCMGLFQCYLLLLIEWKQSWFSLINVTGNGEQERRAGIHQIWHKEYKHLSPCELCGNNGQYVLQCKNLRLSSVITEYEKGTSKYLHGLQVVKVLDDGLL